MSLSFKELYELYRKIAPKVVDLLEPRRYVLEGASSQNYISPIKAVAGDILNTHLLAHDSPEIMGAMSPGQFNNIKHFYLAQQGAWINCSSPIYYLAPDIGEALMDTDLPPELTLTDMLWPYPALRVFLPHGLLTYGGCPVPFLDLAKWPTAGTYTASEPLLDDLDRVYREMGYNPPNELPRITIDNPVITISWNEAYSMDKVSSLPNFMTVTLKAEKISSILLGFKEDQVTPEAERMFNIAMNIILLLGWEPEEISKETLLRKAQTSPKGEVTRTALWSPRFIGRPVFGAARKSSGISNGRQTFEQVRKAHWKRQVYGPGRTERKLIRVQLYRTKSREERGLTKA